MADTSGVFDLAIIGGGINGAGIARDAAGRGLSVVLFEKGDLASGTSSASTKLIHGGLRYLEHYAFRLVREALAEREVLWGIAPHVIWPLRFVLPHHPGLRPAWLLRLGLFLYDHMGGRRLLPPTRTLDLRHDPLGARLRPGFGRAFEYSDCWVDDARLVVLNARDAADRGAAIRPRTRVAGAHRADGLWVIEAEGAAGRESVRARVLVDAAGPWAGQVLDVLQVKANARLRLVQGSHIVVHRLFAHDRCYLFQNADGRIVFAIPYEGDFTLIGTTDLDYSGRPEDVAASPGEVAYLCAAASEYFAASVSPEQVVWTYSGVRALYDDGAGRAQEATRDYVLALDAPEGGAPLLSVFGGKITTYRRLAEAALGGLAPHLPSMGPPFTATAPLPGGDFPRQGFEHLVKALRTAFPALDPALLRRLARAYGTAAFRLLEGVAHEDDLGDWFGAHLCSREVDWLMDREWAMTAEDVLWRRTKLGLRTSFHAAEELETYMAGRRDGGG
ncbi:glycerol-3-phosphate dehydrogenase [Xanthobacter autotrophicus]|uniref:glycerol-3-phosphate dehydrogenase n=1 Tax=Xanthobacter TaxID=279 RepID=UPI0024AA347B|nr:glycerol-3-phosphate dehydrogenase [Xanthobacter autotrophicus]MDI4665213.1 glycerol-3-phosphate dehydrogenase [Xanthobacter autotrophicus]